MDLTRKIYLAVPDYQLLLNKKYPQKRTLDLVADHYQLSRKEKTVLYRGLTTENKLGIRKKKLLSGNPNKENVFIVDGINQIYSIAAYINGEPVFISTDGFLRDTSEKHGESFNKNILIQAVNLIREVLVNLQLKSQFYIDNRVNDSGVLFSIIQHVFQGAGMDPVITLSDHVDADLIKINNAVVATSDSQIIEKTSALVFDLARYTLYFHFDPKIPDLNDLLRKK